MAVILAFFSVLAKCRETVGSAFAKLESREFGRSGKAEVDLNVLVGTRRNGVSF
jgi:hypothetical protein